MGKFKEIQPTSLKLEVGDSVEGFYRGNQMQISYDGSEKDLIVLEIGKDITKTIPVSTVLERKMHDIKLNDYIRIVRVEDIESNSGRTVKNYGVFVRED